MKPQIGIQLYSVRNSLAKDFDGTIAKLAQMGFGGVELAFFYGGKTPRELAALLAAHNLRTVGIYELVENLCNPESTVYSFAEALNCQYITFGVDPDMMKNDYEAAVEVCRRTVAQILAKGLIPCYHAHTFEFLIERNGENSLDALFREKGLEKMTFEADTCWIGKAGKDIVGYMEKYADRIPMIHVKDLGTDNEVTELGRGVIDFRSVAAFAVRHRIPWLTYELDFSRTTELDSAEISIRHLKECLA